MTMPIKFPVPVSMIPSLNAQTATYAQGMLETLKQLRPALRDVQIALVVDDFAEDAFDLDDIVQVSASRTPHGRRICVGLDADDNRTPGEIAFLYETGRVMSELGYPKVSHRHAVGIAVVREAAVFLRANDPRHDGDGWNQSWLETFITLLHDVGLDPLTVASEAHDCSPAIAPMRQMMALAGSVSQESVSETDAADTETVTSPPDDDAAEVATDQAEAATTATVNSKGRWL